MLSVGYPGQDAHRIGVWKQGSVFAWYHAAAGKLAGSVTS